MAIHGFFRVPSEDAGGKADVVQCFACGLKLWDWNPDTDTALGEHSKKKANCPMVEHGYDHYAFNDVCSVQQRESMMEGMFASSLWN